MIGSVIALILSHPIWLCLIGPFFFGGETILVLSILAGQGLISFWIVLIFCALGMFLADTAWFLAGKIKFFSRMKKYKWIHASYKRAKEEIEIAPNNSFLLILIKFSYGIAIPILMYLGREKMTLKEFIVKNSIIIFIWSSSIVLIGWLIGKTSAIAFSRFENIYTSIMLIVTSLIILHLIIRYMRKKIIFKAEHRRI